MGIVLIPGDFAPSPCIGDAGVAPCTCRRKRTGHGTSGRRSKRKLRKVNRDLATGSGAATFDKIRPAPSGAGEVTETPLAAASAQSVGPDEGLGGGADGWPHPR